MLHEEMSTLGITNIQVDRRLAATEWPKITLVTAVYNGEEYLEATMRSIVNQAYPNLEYIVVDDGSTDGTVEV
jgi:cellulose synthase/poly-beta-1,6-N-acetylglucosamine synthase-like glycosyltransferase